MTPIHGLTYLVYLPRVFQIADIIILLLLKVHGGQIAIFEVYITNSHSIGYDYLHVA